MIRELNDRCCSCGTGLAYDDRLQSRTRRGRASVFLWSPVNGNTVRYLSIGVENALELAARTSILGASPCLSASASCT